MSTVYLKWATRPNQTYTPRQKSINQSACAICCNPHLRGGAWIGLPGGATLDLCATDARRLRGLSPLERASAIAELAARHVLDYWRIAA